MESFFRDLQVNVQAGAPIIQIISHDTLRLQAMVIEASESDGINRKTYFWNRTEGLKCYQSGSINNAIISLDEVLDWFLSIDNNNDDFSDTDMSPENSILLLDDIRHELEGDNPSLFSKLRSYAIKKGSGENFSRTLILSQPVPNLPIELEKDAHILHLPLPNRATLKTLLNATKDHYDILDRNFDESSRLIDAALGLSSAEAQLAFAKAAVARSKLTELEIDIVVAEKEQVIKKSGLLE
ncbi:hypothetical protein ACU5DF_00930 [Aliivibrio wodanis]|uniref:hypothetical protein n=1 Tax=Aliivibrio wodanis TaxID=80852 RepID=UPI00406CF2D6